MSIQTKEEQTVTVLVMYTSLCLTSRKYLKPADQPTSSRSQPTAVTSNPSTNTTMLLYVFTVCEHKHTSHKLKAARSGPEEQHSHQTLTDEKRRAELIRREAEWKKTSRCTFSARREDISFLSC